MATKFHSPLSCKNEPFSLFFPAANVLCKIEWFMYCSKESCVLTNNLWVVQISLSIYFPKINELFLEQINPIWKQNLLHLRKLCLTDKSLSTVAKLNWMTTDLLQKIKKLLIKFSQWHSFVQNNLIWWHTHCTDTLSIPSNSELQNS